MAAISEKLIGICLSTIQMEDRFAFVKALNRYAVAHGFRLLIFNSCTDLFDRGNPNDDGERSVFELIPYESLSAMIIFPHFLFNDPVVDTIIERCRAHRLPVITIDKEVPGCTCFTFSYADIFERLCAHVIDDHHAKSLLMMAGMKNNQYSDQRVAAFRKALTERGMYYDDSLIGYGYFWDAPALDVMREWFEEEERPYPDAIICANDSMAIAVSTYLQKHGCRVPEDCIVTGFDCILQSRYHIPHLTTCRQDYETMGSRLIHAIEAMLRGETVPAKNVVSFSMIRSQSCGCKPVSFYNINDAAQEMYDSLRLSAQRQEMMCSVQSAIARMESVQDLPAILSDKFVFPTNVFAINEDIFQEPEYGAHHRLDSAYSENVNVIFQRYFWYQPDPCAIPREQLVPHLEMMLSREEPIIVCALHFIDLTLGYCVFQPEVTVDDYEKMHAFMNAMNASFGTFHGQMQIRSINRALENANEELEKLYIHDYLTGLYNRRGFYRAFRNETAAQHDADLCAFVISVDLDGLKQINDSFGHQEGDSAICTVAKALAACCGTHEICARFGGDEFAVGGFVPKSLTEIRAEQFRHRLTEYLEQYNRSSGKPYQVAASIGFHAEPADPAPDPDALFRIADDRMYADKAERKEKQKA